MTGSCGDKAGNGTDETEGALIDGVERSAAAALLSADMLWLVERFLGTEPGLREERLERRLVGGFLTGRFEEVMGELADPCEEKECTS